MLISARNVITSSPIRPGTIFGGIMKCDVLAQGVVDAAKETKINLPIVVRLAGTNFEQGKKILDNSGLKIISASDLSDAAEKIVKEVK